MIRSTTIVTPAADTDLIDLATVKADLGVSGSADDARLSRLITRASSAVQEAIGRTLAVETVADTFDADPGRGVEHRHALILSRVPVLTITSVVEAGVTLTAGTNYRVNTLTGETFRLSGGLVTSWTSPIVVTYTTGFATIPPAIVDVVVGLIRAAYHGADQDPALRSEKVEGIGEFIYGQRSNGFFFPDAALQVLDRYRLHTVI